VPFHCGGIHATLRDDNWGIAMWFFDPFALQFSGNRGAVEAPSARFSFAVQDEFQDGVFSLAEFFANGVTPQPQPPIEITVAPLVPDVVIADNFFAQNAVEFADFGFTPQPGITVFEPAVTDWMTSLRLDSTDFDYFF
jgi:hypothetical protein